MDKLIPNLFYFFLLAPILNPYVGGITIYLSSFFLLFDVKFIKWLIANFYPNNIILFVSLVLCMSFLPLHITTFFKIIYASLSIVYIIYTYLNDRFYLYIYLIFNICFAIIQFSLTIVNPAFAVLLGPSNISKLIWGKFATPTYTNFYEVFLLPRVSGLSREGGFFAALINICLLIVYKDQKLQAKQKKILFIFFIIGIIISISKTSIIFLLGLIIIKYYNQLRKISLTFTYVFLGVFFILFTNYLYISNTSFYYNPINETFIHRFGGYALTPYLSLNQLLNGVSVPDLFLTANNKMVIIASIFKSKNLIAFCGYSSLYLNNGILFWALFLVLIKYIRINTPTFLLLILFTSDVTPISSDGFVQLGWFFCFMLLIQEFRIKNYN